MATSTEPEVPPYGVRTLAEVVPSLLTAIGAAGFANPLGIAPADSVCLLMIDGLGWELLQAHGPDAPVLSGLACGSEPLSAGFPATTAVSLASLGTGRPCGEHGIVGYAFADPEVGLMNALTWRTQGTTPVADLRAAFPPELAQPLPTLFERAVLGGIDVTLTAPGYQGDSGLTRAVLRGGGFRPVVALGDLAALSTSGTPGSFRYAYHGDLDMLGHRYGPGSLPWRLQLAQVDQLVASVAARLPVGALLVVTADHGMVEVPDAGRVDADADTTLQQGVRLLGGEVRVRHVYSVPGASADVLAGWRATLGDRAWVRCREDAIAAGWFGPSVTDRARARIGDVVAAMRGTHGVIRSVAEPLESALLGHHGSLTTAEQLVPLLLVRG